MAAIAIYFTCIIAPHKLINFTYSWKKDYIQQAAFSAVYSVSDYSNSTLTLESLKKKNLWNSN